MTQGWLKCHILKGMFSDERVVVFHLVNGERYSEFVPAEKVRGEINSDGALAVGIYRQDGASFVELPNEYQDLFAVADKDLVPA